MLFCPNSVSDDIQGGMKTLTNLHAEALATNGSASDATVTPLINELVSAISSANGELTLGSLGLVKRDDEAIAVLVAGILKVFSYFAQLMKRALIDLTAQDITETLNTLLVDVAVAVPALSGLLITVDVALDTLLSSVELLVAGVLKLVAGLYVFRL